MIVSFFTTGLLSLLLLPFWFLRGTLTLRSWLRATRRGSRLRVLSDDLLRVLSWLLRLFQFLRSTLSLRS